MANCRAPKYKYGLMESPMSSYFSSSGNELSTTLPTDGNPSRFGLKDGLPAKKDRAFDRGNITGWC